MTVNGVTGCVVTHELLIVNAVNGHEHERLTACAINGVNEHAGLRTPTHERTAVNVNGTNTNAMNARNEAAR